MRPQGCAIALIGADGAGKTTVAKVLQLSLPLPVKYLYMGLSTKSSNLALPTSRAVEFLKVQASQCAARKRDNRSMPATPAPPSAHRSREPGTLWVIVRLLNRLAEAYYRQLVSWAYQLQGYIVVYDRHFLFEAAPGIEGLRVVPQPPSDRLYYRTLSRWYPRPDLVIFLDAPAEVLDRRKGEITHDALERRRGAFLNEGRKGGNFVRVDAAQPLDKVIEEVKERIVEFCASRARERT